MKSCDKTFVDRQGVRMTCGHRLIHIDAIAQCPWCRMYELKLDMDILQVQKQTLKEQGAKAAFLFQRVIRKCKWAVGDQLYIDINNWMSSRGISEEE